MRQVSRYLAPQKGQAIVAALIIMLLAVSGLVLMYNTGQATSEKLRVVNAADAAAYSGGVWVARQLNFMAYTNRAMIANHVSVGHFVSFASWIRNTETNIKYVDRIATIFPPVKAVTQIVKQVATIYRNATEQFGSVYVSAINLFNQGLYASQIAARANLNAFTVNDVMQSTARNYGNLQVNNADDLRDLARQSFSTGGTSSRRGVVAADTVIGQFETLLFFTDSYDAIADNSRAAGLVETSLDSSERWIQGNRGWRVTPFPFRLRKRGSTVHTSRGPTNECNRRFSGGANSSNSESLNWYAKDELQLERFSFSRGRFRTFARSCDDANATEFSSNYKGIDNYTALRNQRSEHQTLSIYAYATLDTNESVVPVYHTFREVDPNDPHYEVKRTQAITENKTTALVEAQVFHGSDEELLFSTDVGEYSNLFNPYWHARSHFSTYDKISAVVAGVNN